MGVINFVNCYGFRSENGVAERPGRPRLWSTAEEHSAQALIDALIVAPIASLLILYPITPTKTPQSPLS